MTFRIIHELETLSEEERRQYATDASIYFGLDPELGGLDFIWMNNETGFRKLVLYARRGITDILRDKHKINVTELLQTPINGSLATTVTGQDSTGRQEIAVGSNWIEGLREKALDDAIMTSQTRALRRLTLQFVGGGILDESEVGGTTVHATAEAVIPPVQPTVQPSSAPGKDVTKVIELMTIDHTTEPVRVEYHTVNPDEQIPPHCGVNKVVTETREAFIQRLNREEPKEEPKKRAGRPRRSKTTVDFGPSEPPPTSAKTSANDPAINPVIQAPPVSVTPAAPVLTAETKADIKADISPAKPRLSEAVEKPFRQRLFSFMTHLEKKVDEGGGGLTPSLGVGNREKIIRFASTYFPEVNSLKDLTADQWEKFLSHVEGYSKTNGAVATVKYIEKAIGL